MEELINKLKGLPYKERQLEINKIKELLYNVSGNKNPVNRVLLVPIEKVTPNDYNPNSVAVKEMNLLYISIKEDGYTQPVVTFYDSEQDMYVIVDGFHRYFTMKSNSNIYEANEGLLPIVVIEKDLANRMASTVRHNRARGSHNIGGMSNIVYGMLEEGKTEQEICNRLGLELEELLRLKHITGFSKLFKDVNYSQSWEDINQVKLRKEYNLKQKNENSKDGES